MDIEKWFFPSQVPERFLYLGEGRSLLLTKNRKGLWEVGIRFPFGLNEMGGISALPGLPRGPIGLTLNPNPFVFNLFHFDAPLPRNARKRLSMIDWRLQRVYPEAPASMVKANVIYRNRMVLSTLVEEALLRGLESQLQTLGMTVTHISCPCVDVIAHSARLTSEPLLVLEQEGALLLALVVRRGVPLFVRKIRFSHTHELVQTVQKTLSFVAEQQGVEIQRYLVNPLSEAEVASWIGDLDTLQPLGGPPGERLRPFLP